MINPVTTRTTTIFTGHNTFQPNQSRSTHHAERVRSVMWTTNRIDLGLAFRVDETVRYGCVRSEPCGTLQEESRTFLARLLNFEHGFPEVRAVWQHFSMFYKEHQGCPPEKISFLCRGELESAVLYRCPFEQ